MTKAPSSPLEISVKDFLEVKDKTEILVIDPCYLFDHSVDELDTAWQYFVDLMYKPESEKQKLDRLGILKFKGATMLYTGTAYGDGCYTVKSRLEQIGTDCGVDAGMLCFISKEDALKINPDFKNWDSGVILKDFQGTLEMDGEGNLSGSCGVSCITGDNEDEEE